MNMLHSITLHRGNIAVVCGGVLCGFQGWFTKVRYFNLQTGAQFSWFDPHDPYRLAEVKLGGKPALALACRFVK